MTTKSVFISAGFLLSMFVTAPAFADAIDGQWCHKGRQVTIEGPLIITPSGKRVNGTFDRHSFSYTIPAGDDHAGEKADLVVQHDTLMHFMRSGSSQFEAWQPCPAPIS